MKANWILIFALVLIAGCKNPASQVIDDLNDDIPSDNLPPYAVSGPTGTIQYYEGDSIVLEFSDASGNPVVPAGSFDPDGDEVVFTATVESISGGGIEPQLFVVDGILTIEWLVPNVFRSASIRITTHDDAHIDNPVQPTVLLAVAFLVL